MGCCFIGRAGSFHTRPAGMWAELVNQYFTGTMLAVIIIASDSNVAIIHNFSVCLSICTQFNSFQTAGEIFTKLSGSD